MTSVLSFWKIGQVSQKLPGEKNLERSSWANLSRQQRVGTWDAGSGDRSPCLPGGYPIDWGGCYEQLSCDWISGGDGSSRALLWAIAQTPGNSWDFCCLRNEMIGNSLTHWKCSLGWYWRVGYRFLRAQRNSEAGWYVAGRSAMKEASWETFLQDGSVVCDSCMSPVGSWLPWRQT